MVATLYLVDQALSVAILLPCVVGYALQFWEERAINLQHLMELEKSGRLQYYRGRATSRGGRGGGNKRAIGSMQFYLHRIGVVATLLELVRCIDPYAVLGVWPYSTMLFLSVNGVVALMAAFATVFLMTIRIGYASAMQPLPPYVGAFFWGYCSLSFVLVNALAVLYRVGTVRKDFLIVGVIMLLLDLAYITMLSAFWYGLRLLRQTLVRIRLDSIGHDIGNEAAKRKTTTTATAAAAQKASASNPDNEHLHVPKLATAHARRRTYSLEDPMFTSDCESAPNSARRRSSSRSQDAPRKKGEDDHKDNKDDNGENERADVVTPLPTQLTKQQTQHVTRVNVAPRPASRKSTFYSKPRKPLSHQAKLENSVENMARFLRATFAVCAVAFVVQTAIAINSALKWDDVEVYHPDEYPPRAVLRWVTTSLCVIVLHFSWLPLKHLRRRLGASRVTPSQAVRQLHDIDPHAGISCRLPRDYSNQSSLAVPPKRVNSIRIVDK